VLFPCEEFLTGLAKAPDIETLTREELARLDRKREKRTSNKEWESSTNQVAHRQNKKWQHAFGLHGRTCCRYGERDTGHFAPV
jgi:hypothetical protein